ncbi:hypothetical protein BRSU_2757 [Brachyspira suanatina]|uniref:DUF3592 domain-containing protein n=1 Tax=Brachyspira suanatina TaxID=381802 RepID=A0A0G4KBH4_9SPIR|nr:hypothetical protein [Brachyspira suanatina]CRF35592.1 hypothetical protein BRSU_2757 [Brachyspira suanatina]
MNIKIIKAAILTVGILLILGAISGFFSIFIASKKYVHTVCIVKQYNTKKVYKSRKLRYENTMLISYETERYGTLYTTLKSYYPFRKVGDKLTLWFDPNKPKNIKLPFSESCIYMLLIVSGSICIYAVIWLYGKK